MRIILKIFAAPFVPILTILGAFCIFLIYLSSWFFYIASSLLGMMGLVILFTDSMTNGIVVLIMAFVIFIIPTIAEWVVDKLNKLNITIQCFLTS